MYAKMAKSRKRKAGEQRSDDEGRNLPLDQLNSDLLEQVLSWLPTSNFFRVTSVCKRWKSVADSATFRQACSRVPSRDPCYFMAADSQSYFNTQPVVFDTAENSWKMLNYCFPPSPSLLLQQNQRPNFVPVASSGGLICFRSEENQFIVCNPVTGASHHLVPCNNNDSDIQQTKSLRAIAMISGSESYKLVLVYGETSELSFKTYNSKSNRWEEETRLIRKTDNSPAESADGGDADTASAAAAAATEEDENAVYFLSKCGNVVSTDLQRSPCKQYSSVITTNKNGEEIMHFLSSSGRVISCNLTTKCYAEYPRLLPPVYHEYSVDLIECGGEVSAVVLSEFLESASLRIWRFDETGKFWHQIGAMPPAMSHEFYGKKVDINCSAGNGEKIMVCFNSAEICRYFLYDLVCNKWIQLPNCHVKGELREFSCAFSFEPRIEASVCEQ